MAGRHGWLGRQDAGSCGGCHAAGCRGLWTAGGAQQRDQGVCGECPALPPVATLVSSPSMAGLSCVPPPPAQLLPVTLLHTPHVHTPASAPAMHSCQPCSNAPLPPTHQDAFTSRMAGGPHLLAPTGADLAKNSALGTVFAGYHYDLNFCTIHGAWGPPARKMFCVLCAGRCVFAWACGSCRRRRCSSTLLCHASVVFIPPPHPHILEHHTRHHTTHPTPAAGKSRFPGLSVWLADGRRVPVRIPPGCLLLQAGRQMEWLTGGHVQAGWHEVRRGGEVMANCGKGKDDAASIAACRDSRWRTHPARQRRRPQLLPLHPCFQTFGP